MNILITGISGFVARHFVDHLSTLGIPAQVSGIHNSQLPSFQPDFFPHIQCRFFHANLLDEGRLKEILQEVKPRYILHLASKSSVAYSWQHPAETIRHNTGIFINLIETVRKLQIPCRILSVGSAEEYGIVPDAELPIRENRCPNPASPYGTSRMLQQKLVEIYAGHYGIDILHTRSFNHIGPWQQPDFVISSFCRQMALGLKNGLNPIPLECGDLKVIRDFTDVRDVARAYWLLLQNGTAGETYNVCSGRGVMLEDIVQLLEQITGTTTSRIQHEKNLRPTENKKLIGSHQKINRELGWAPEIPLEKSLRDLMNYWKDKV